MVFHSLRHTSVTYKLKLSGGDIKAVQGDSGHAQADMVMEVYGTVDESTWQSGDGGIAEESDKEYEDVSGNLRSVGFGRNPKGDSSFLYFILLWIY